jgi:hypothetical protein
MPRAKRRAWPTGRGAGTASGSADIAGGAAGRGRNGSAERDKDFRERRTHYGAALRSGAVRSEADPLRRRPAVRSGPERSKARQSPAYSTGSAESAAGSPQSLHNGPASAAASPLVQNAISPLPAAPGFSVAATCCDASRDGLAGVDDAHIRAGDGLDQRPQEHEMRAAEDQRVRAARHAGAARTAPRGRASPARRDRRPRPAPRVPGRRA